MAAMNMEINFDTRRFGRILRFEAETNGARFGIFLAATLGLYALFCLLHLLRRQDMGSWPEVISSLALLFGIFATTDVFRDEHNPARAAFRLMLPASLLERFVAKLTLSLLLYPLLFAGGVMVVGNVFAGLATLIGATSFVPVLPSGPFALVMLKVYLLGHAIFFAGSVFFKRLVIGKTVISGALYLGACSIIFAIVGTAWVVETGLWEILVGTLADGHPFPVVGKLEFSKSMVGEGLLWITRALVPMVLYGASWFRFREIEVR